MKSSKQNAVLCAITQLGHMTRWVRRKELGLFWEFQSPDSEFVYLPAVMPHDQSGRIAVTADYSDAVAPVVCYERKKQWIDFLPRDMGGGRAFSEAYDVKYDFTEAEAKAYVDLLKQVPAGSEWFDGTVYAEEYRPSLTQRFLGVSYHGPSE